MCPRSRYHIVIMKKLSYCRVCEAACGIVVEVEDGKVKRISPDEDHPISAGHFCIKGRAAADVAADPSRILHPQMRLRSGWERVSWDHALDEIADRLRNIIEKHGPRSVALYLGNPTAFSALIQPFGRQFIKGIGSPNLFSHLSIDCMNRFLVAEAIYGDGNVVPIPDIENANFMLLFGTNPLVSMNTQLSTHPRGVKEMLEAKRRGATIVVVDPRLTETAKKASMHVPIRPGTDVFLIWSLIHQIVGRGLTDDVFIKRYCSDFDVISGLSSRFTPDRVQKITGVDKVLIAQIAQEFAHSSSAFAIGRTGVSLSLAGTLAEWGLAILNIITGNMDRPGGMYVNRGAVGPLLRTDGKKVSQLEGPVPSRVRPFGRFMGELPCCVMADEILTPGPGQIKALIVCGGNPLLSFPDGNKLARALESLDLFVAIDLFINETAKLAHFFLPSTMFLERTDATVLSSRFYPIPFCQWTDAVADKPGEVMEEWRIFAELAKRLDVPLFGSKVDDSWIEKGEEIAYEHLFKNARVTLDELRAFPRGVVVGGKEFGAMIPHLIKTEDRKVRMAPESFVRALETLDEDRFLFSGRGPFYLIGRRHISTMNSWMHRVLSLKIASGLCSAYINPEDARKLGIVHGDTVIIFTRNGRIRLPAMVTKEVPPRVVSVPHGWGVEEASAPEGANINLLADDQEVDPLSGLPAFNGLRCNVRKAR